MLTSNGGRLSTCQRALIQCSSSIWHRAMRALGRDPRRIDRETGGLLYTVIRVPHRREKPRRALNRDSGWWQYEIEFPIVQSVV